MKKFDIDLYISFDPIKLRLNSKAIEVNVNLWKL